MFASNVRFWCWIVCFNHWLLVHRWLGWLESFWMPCAELFCWRNSVRLQSPNQLWYSASKLQHKAYKWPDIPLFNIIFRFFGMLFIIVFCLTGHFKDSHHWTACWNPDIHYIHRMWHLSHFPLCHPAHIFGLWVWIPPTTGDSPFTFDLI